MKRYYAARHTHGTEFTYDGGGWTAFVFDSKADRDAFVERTNTADSRAGYNQRSEACTRDEARKIAGQRVKEVPIHDGPGYRLDYDPSYRADYWN